MIVLAEGVAGIYETSAHHFVLLFNFCSVRLFLFGLILHCFCGPSVTSGSDCNHGLGVRYLFRGWEHGELVHSGVSSLEMYISGPLLLPPKLRFRGEDAVTLTEKFDTRPG